MSVIILHWNGKLRKENWTTAAAARPASRIVEDTFSLKRIRGRLTWISFARRRPEGGDGMTADVTNTLRTVKPISPTGTLVPGKLESAHRVK